MHRLNVEPEKTGTLTVDEVHSFGARFFLTDLTPEQITGFLRTGAGAHGLYPSRDARVMYVSNREAGSISVVSFRTRKVIKTWQLPLPASPEGARRRP